MATWVVTGVNRGIGLAFARALSARGERIVGTARRPETANELRDTGARVEKLDVSDDGSVAEFAKRLGGEAVTSWSTTPRSARPDHRSNNSSPATSCAP